MARPHAMLKRMRNFPPPSLQCRNNTSIFIVEQSDVPIKLLQSPTRLRDAIQTTIPTVFRTYSHWTLSEPNKPNQYVHLYTKFILTLFSHLRLGLRSGSSLSRFLTNVLYIFLVPPIHVKAQVQSSPLRTCTYSSHCSFFRTCKHNLYSSA